MKTPYYVFDADLLLNRLGSVRQVLPGIPVTFSVKANSFVTGVMSSAADHLEVCSPGELEICKKLRVRGEKIIYSGVMKEAVDLRAAMAAGTGLLTAESPAQLQLIRETAAACGKQPRVLLRLSSGNQFGMDADDLLAILRDREAFSPVTLAGIHFYSGTQKKKAAQIENDLSRLRALLRTAREETGFEPELVEYGPGLAAEYFKPGDPGADDRLLAETAPLLLDFAKEVPLGLEFGRFLAAPCGTYYTAVKDLKTTEGVHYAILDGGIHHLRYYGQMMAINRPPVARIPQGEAEEGPETAYCLCGSLCTVADVLVKDVPLAELHPGDLLAFEKCGAYSVTESSALFLSRDLPAVYLKQDGKLTPVRPAVPAWEINCPVFPDAEN